MISKSQLVSVFEEMAFLESDNEFKSRAYKRCAGILKSMDFQTFIDTLDFRSIKGIGDGLNDKILEFKETGRVAKLDELRKEHPTKLNPKLYKVRKSYITRRIPYDRAEAYVKRLREILGCKFLVAGSYRRKSELIGDIDIIVRDKDYHICLQILTEKFKTLSSGNYKSSFLIDETNGIQLDIIGVPKDEIPYQVLYLTGSKEFNIYMRTKARSLGYLLNQNGLYKDGGRVAGVNSEEDIFKFLDIPYRKPEDR